MMPATLKRSRRRELTLTPSFLNVIRSKVGAAQALFSPSPREPSIPPRPTTFRPSHVQANVEARNPYPRLRRPIHPIHTLPPELLAHIFVLGSQSSVMLPVAVTHVCSAWRRLALRTPALWRCISLGVGSEEMWQERMYRAKACSWDVELKPHSALRPRFLDLHSVLWHMHLVTPYIYRWRSFHISFTYYAPFLLNAALSGCCASNNPNVHAPALEEISLVYNHNDDTKEFTLFAGYAPRLRRVTLSGMRLTWLPSLFENLTYLDYTHHRFTHGYQAALELLAMLDVSNGIRDLRVQFHSRAEDGERPNHAVRRIVLPFLGHLHLRVDGNDIPIELYYLMTHIATPSLISFHLLDPSHSPYPFSRLSSFLRLFVLPVSLIALRIENGWYDPSVVSWLLRVLPNVQQVVVKDPSAPERVFVEVGKRRRGRKAPDAPSVYDRTPRR